MPLTFSHAFAGLLVQSVFGFEPIAFGHSRMKILTRMGMGAHKNWHSDRVLLND